MFEGNGKGLSSRILARLGGLGDIRRDNNFILVIHDLMEDNELELIIEKVPAPRETTQKIELRRGNDVINFPGGITHNLGTITVLDVLNPDEIDKLWTWWRSVYNPTTGQIYKASNFKKNGTIYEYASDGTCLRMWNLEGLFPLGSPQHGDFDASSSGSLKRVNLELSVDACDIIPVYEGFKNVADISQLRLTDEDSYDAGIVLYGGNVDSYFIKLKEAQFRQLRQLISICERGIKELTHSSSPNYRYYAASLTTAKRITEADKLTTITAALDDLSRWYSVMSLYVEGVTP